MCSVAIHERNRIAADGAIQLALLRLANLVTIAAGGTHDPDDLVLHAPEDSKDVLVVVFDDGIASIDSTARGTRMLVIDVCYDSVAAATENKDRDHFFLRSAGF
jgi:hypothetical protein